MSGFKVQKKMCKTCIYREDSTLDLEHLENQVRDEFMGFKGHRTCHHSDDACCRGLWEAIKFLANRLRMLAITQEVQE